MKYSDIGHAFNRTMKIMSIHLCKRSDSLVVRWQLTDQAYLDRNLEKPFLCTRVIFYVRRIGLYLYKYRIYGTITIYILKGVAPVYHLI